MEAPRELLSEFTRVLSVQPADELPRRLCRAFANVVGADGAAIALGSETGSRSLLAVTDTDTERLEDLQDMLGEGPSIRALRGDGPAVLDGGSDTGQSWPALVSALLEHSAGREPPALYAFPMRPQQAVLGVLTARQDARSDLRVALDDAQFLANAIGIAVLGGLDPRDATGEGWLVHDRISQATGMVIAQLGFPAADALAVLRAHAYAHDVTLSEVSRRVVDRSLRFTADYGGEES